MKAKCVINATGPFTDSLRKMDNQGNQNICQPSAGVHIVIPGYYRYRRHLLPDPHAALSAVSSRSDAAEKQSLSVYAGFFFSSAKAY